MVNATLIQTALGTNGTRKTRKPVDEAMLHVAWSIPAGPQAMAMRALLRELGIDNVMAYVRELVQADLTARVATLNGEQEEGQESEEPEEAD